MCRGDLLAPNLVSLLVVSFPSIHDHVQFFRRVRGLVKIVGGGWGVIPFLGYVDLRNCGQRGRLCMRGNWYVHGYIILIISY